MPGLSDYSWCSSHREKNAQCHPLSGLGGTSGLSAKFLVLGRAGLTAKPTTKTQVCVFFGLAGYYWCFIPNFSSVVSPLTDLSKKGQQKRVVKCTLTLSLVLHSPDF